MVLGSKAQRGRGKKFTDVQGLSEAQGWELKQEMGFIWPHLCQFILNFIWPGDSAVLGLPMLKFFSNRNDSVRERENPEVPGTPRGWRGP